MVRYIDSGDRDPGDALGTWLGTELLGSSSVSALRVQTGFFSSDSLGYFEDTLHDLQQTDGHTRFLVGSNDGLTPRSAVADLLGLIGPPRPGSRVGVVSYQSGYFHPKVVHIEREDGTHAAYVGSANLTGAGVASLHVEAGLIVDTAQHDPQSVLDEIADAIDKWFEQSRAGLYEVAVDADLDPLVRDQIIDVSPPPRTKRAGTTSGTGGSRTSARSSLSPLVATPPLRTQQTPQNAAPSGSPSGQPSAGPPPTPTSPIEERWGKQLSASDADRKPGSKSTPRAAIPLGQGRLRGRIDQSWYFRHQMFGQLDWTEEFTRTDEPYDVAYASIHVTVDGTYHGLMDFRLSHDPRRQQGERNLPTTQLHTAPLAEVMKQRDITGMELTIERDQDGEYWLTID